MQADLIECQKGFQAEVAINSCWTAYSKVRKDKAMVRRDVDRLAKLIDQPIIITNPERSE